MSTPWLASHCPAAMTCPSAPSTAATYSSASGAMSAMISAQPVPCGVLASTLPARLKARIALARGTSPAATSAAYLWKPKSRMPTFTPRPVTPACCKASAFTSATPSLTRSP